MFLSNELVNIKKIPRSNSLLLYGLDEPTSKGLTLTLINSRADNTSQHPVICLLYKSIISSRVLVCRCRLLTEFDRQSLNWLSSFFFITSFATCSLALSKIFAQMMLKHLWPMTFSYITDPVFCFGDGILYFTCRYTIISSGTSISQIVILYLLRRGMLNTLWVSGWGSVGLFKFRGR